MTPRISTLVNPVRELSAAAVKEDSEIESLLAAIPGDSPAGVDSLTRKFYGDIENFRKTEDRDGPLGALREGEARTADWTKVFSLASRAIAGHSKDLGLAFYFTEAAGRKNGLKGIAQGLNLIRGLCERYWTEMYPKVADGLDERTFWLEKLDGVLPKVIGEVQITQASDEKVYVFWQWQGLEIERQQAGRNKDPGDRAKAVAEAIARKLQFDQAATKTDGAFYERLYHDINTCSEACERLMVTIDERLQAEPTVQQLEELPSFYSTRKALKELFVLTDQIFRSKGVESPAKPHVTANEEVAITAGALPEAESNGVVARGNNGVAVRSGVLTREDAIVQLSTIASFFRKTEPHSPVGYLIERAIRWSNLSLTQVLEEVLHDSTALAKVRETLGIESK